MTHAAKASKVRSSSTKSATKRACCQEEDNSKQKLKEKESNFTEYKVKEDLSLEDRRLSSFHPSTSVERDPRQAPKINRLEDKLLSSLHPSTSVERALRQAPRINREPEGG